MPVPPANALPSDLTSLPNWVAWRYETREGSTKPTKVPYNLATGYLAANNNPAHWTEYPDPESVPAAYSGIGFVFTKEAGFAGIDLDDCLTDSGAVKTWALEILASLPSYSEISPSGTGIKVWTRAQLPGKGLKVYLDAEGTRTVESMADGGVEMYDTGRYFAVTGSLWGSNSQITDLQPAVTALYQRLRGNERPELPTHAPSNGNFEIPSGSSIAEGGRHSFLLNQAAKWRARGMDIPDLLNRLRDLNASRCSPPKPDFMLKGIAEWFADKAPTYRLTQRDYASAAQPVAFNGGPAVATQPEEQPVVPLPSASERAEALLVSAIESKDPMLILGVGLAPSELIQALAQNEISKTQRVEAKSRIKKNFKAIDVSLREFDTRLADEIQNNRGLFAVEFQPAASGLPQIMTTSRQLRDITSEALATVNPPAAPVIFIRSGDLVHVVRDEGGRPSVSPASETWIRSVLARSADWMKYNQFGEVKPTFPPMDVVRDMSVLSDLPFPGLTSVTEVPTLRPNGTIISEPGYDPNSGVYYAPAPTLKHFPLPDDPTREQVRAAVENINEAIGEFPYEDEASRANIFGLLLTPVLRPSVVGCTPLAVVDAPQAGTGKSLLIDVLSIITTGRPSAMVPYPYKEEEMQKQIGASLAAGRQLIAFDNLEGELRSPCLALALTAKEYEARILGFSRNMTVPNVSTWIVTGNNIRPTGDMPRRCYQIRLNARQAVPYRGREFKHPDLLKWVFSNRSELLHSLLVISRFWFSRGCPEGATGPAIGSFEDWHRKVSGILRAAQVKGFLANYTAFIEQEDESPRQWEGFLEQLFEDLARGEENCSRWFLVSELLPMVGGTMVSSLRDCLPAEIADCLDRKVNHLIVIGKMFRSRRERRFGAYCLERNTKETTHKGAASWRVRKHVPTA